MATGSSPQSPPPCLLPTSPFFFAPLAPALAPPFPSAAASPFSASARFLPVPAAEEREGEEVVREALLTPLTDEGGDGDDDSAPALRFLPGLVEVLVVGLPLVVVVAPSGPSGGEEGWSWWAVMANSRKAEAPGSSCTALPPSA